MMLRLPEKSPLNSQFAKYMNIKPEEKTKRLKEWFKKKLQEDKKLKKEYRKLKLRKRGAMRLERKKKYEAYFHKKIAEEGDIIQRPPSTPKQKRKQALQNQQHLEESVQRLHQACQLYKLETELHSRLAGNLFDKWLKEEKDNKSLSALSDENTLRSIGSRIISLPNNLNRIKNTQQIESIENIKRINVINTKSTNNTKPLVGISKNSNSKQWAKEKKLNKSLSDVIYENKPKNNNGKKIMSLTNTLSTIHTMNRIKSIDNRADSLRYINGDNTERDDNIKPLTHILKNTNTIQAFDTKTKQDMIKKNKKQPTNRCNKAINTTIKQPPRIDCWWTFGKASKSCWKMF